MTTVKAFTQLQRDEGLRLQPYKDSQGILTIGYGHNLEEGITKEQADALLKIDLDAAAVGVLKALPWASRLSLPRFYALVNMAFNMGVRNLLSFAKMLRDMQEEVWGSAANEIRSSQWREQVGERAERIAKQIELDEWQ